MPAAHRKSGTGTLAIEVRDAIAFVALNRPGKRNALDDATVSELHGFFIAPPPGVAVAVLSGAGEHFCAGLDLSELRERSAAEGVAHSRMWHAAFSAIQFGTIPVIAVLHGAVVGGGLELACAAHLRVADRSTYYAFPEGQRGIFLGGGGTVRVPKLIGAHRVADMMLTGRVLSAEEGESLGLSNYLVETGQGLSRAEELARRVAQNAPMTNYALLQALPRIAELGQDTGLFMESLMAGIAQSEPEAKRRMRDFLEKRAGKVRRD
jgi:(methylthio)acryloyl-CoA hydratase